MKRKKTKPGFVLCIRNDGCEDLEQRRIYKVLYDRAAEREGFFRVVDESGEDYLYPASNFVPIHLPEAAVKAMGLPA